MSGEPQAAQTALCPRCIARLALEMDGYIVETGGRHRELQELQTTTGLPLTSLASAAGLAPSIADARIRAAMVALRLIADLDLPDNPTLQADCARCLDHEAESAGIRRLRKWWGVQ